MFNSGHKHYDRNGWTHMEYLGHYIITSSYRSNKAIYTYIIDYV